MRTTACAILAVSVLLLAAGFAAADKVTDAIGQATTAYSGGDYKETSTHLQTALIEVNQLLIDLLLEQFPDPPSGWTADEPEGMDASMIGASFFAGLVVSRDYHTPAGSTVELTVAANSPMLAMLRSFIGNPMLAAMAGQSGMKKISACGFDAIEQADDESGSFDLHVLAGNATLVSYSGQTADDMPHIHTLVDATNCQGFVDVVE